MVADDHRFAAWAATVAGERLRSCAGRGCRAGSSRTPGTSSGTTPDGLLAEYRPDDAVLSEEGKDDKARLTRDRVWIVDPLDGTREYSEPPRDDWAVHVALWEDGDLVAGAVAQPGDVHDVQHRGAPDRAAAHRGRPRIAVSRPGRRPSSRCSPRRSTPSWCRWGRRARR